MNFFRKFFSGKLLLDFSIWIVISIVVSFCLRIIEFVSILKYHSLFDGLIKYTLIGWVNDLVIWSLLLFFLFPVYWFLHKFTKIANLFFLILTKVDEKQIPHSIIKNKSHYFYKKTAKFFLIGSRKDTLINYEDE